MSEIFTPGPWRADWDDDGQWYIEPLGISGHALRGHRSGCVESANAHLIAAAPELFEACFYMHKLLVDMGHGGLAGAILGGNALAKAEPK